MTTPQLPECHPAAELFPLLGKDELAELAADIADNGQNNPIVVLPDGRLLDGRNRWLACAAAQIEPVTRVFDGDEPTAYVMSENLRRRHLNASQRAMAAVDVEPLLAEEARLRQSTMARKGWEGGAADQGEQVVADSPQPGTKERAPLSRDKAAEMTGAAGRSVSTAKRITKQAPDLAEQVRAGGLSLNAAEDQLKRRAAEKQVEKQRDEQMRSVPSNASNERYWLFHGDYTKLAEIPAQTVDLLITEPPAPASFMPIVSSLAGKVERLLVDSGIAVVLVDPIFLPQVLEGMGGGDLKYGWIYNEPTSTETKVMPRQVQTGWRMWAAWSNGPWPQDRLTWHSDMLSEGPEALIQALTPKGGNVCDPFTGAGRFGAAALKAGRRFFGAEADATKFQAATAALEAAS